MKKFIVFTFLSLMVACGSKNKKQEQVVLNNIHIKHINEFGFAFNNYNYIKGIIKKGESFGEILDKAHVSPSKVFKIVKKTKKVFDIRRLKVGNPYVLLKSKDSLDKGEVFIYQPDKINYIVFNFKDSIRAYRAKKKVKTVVKTASGIIKSSLSEAVDEQGLNYIIVNDLSEIYAWTIDFFRLKKNDKFKIIYEEKFVDDSIYAGMGKIKAAIFEHDGKLLYAFSFVENKNIVDYFDDKGKNLRRAFLKAPLKYGRISSRYNLRRYIKYYGRIKPHLGTDFAAPTNTPILATANGVVIKRAYTSGNGNYVKIRHNGTYQTQYLHMNHFKKGVNVGTYVKQGDVIGYVGMTGHASGPHVCYRLWKNGRQVDPLKQKLPAAAPLKKTERSRYITYIKPLKQKLDSIPFSD